MILQCKLVCSAPGPVAIRTNYHLREFLYIGILPPNPFLIVKQELKVMGPGTLVIVTLGSIASTFSYSTITISPLPKSYKNVLSISVIHQNVYMTFIRMAVMDILTWKSI